MRNSVALILCTTLLLPASLYAKQEPPGAAFDHFIDSCTKGLQTPGGVLSIEQDGKLIYERAFGASTLEHPVANTVSTIFEAGSVSKQFTAAAVLLLVNEGKISLQDDIRKYITELPKYTWEIKVEHLLSHTSGIKDWGTVAQMGGWPRTTNTYTETYVQRILFAQRTLNFEPGTQYAYSNSNHNLLRLLVERVSKQPFTAFTQERLFSKAGMKNTQWRTKFTDIVANRALAYKPGPTGFLQDMPFENTYGHAALLTTTQDLLAWNRFLASKGLGENADALRLKLFSFASGNKGAYAYGALFYRTVQGFTEIAHSGSTAGYRAWLAWYPEKKLSVAYLSNHAGIAPVAIARLVTHQLMGTGGSVIAPPVNPQAVQGKQATAAGIYRAEKDPLLIGLEFRGDSLYVYKDPSWNPRYNDPLLLNTRTISLQLDGSLRVATPEDVKIFHKKQPISQQTLQELQNFAGNFYSQECRARVSVSLLKGNLQLAWPAGESFDLTPLFEDAQTVAFLTPNNVLVEFEKQDNQITGFRASLSQEQYAFARADNIEFKRTK